MQIQNFTHNLGAPPLPAMCKVFPSRWFSAHKKSQRKKRQ